MSQEPLLIADYPLHLFMKTILYGVAVGDALGFPMQFKSRDHAQRFPVVDMGKYRDENHNIQDYWPNLVGLWSDDTSLSLCLAESLAIGYDLKEMAFRNDAWLSGGHRSALDYAFDIGRQCQIGIKHALEVAYHDADALPDLILQNIESANGNGALMRILPLLLAIDEEDLDTAFKYVKEVSALTHPHIRSAFVCLFYLRFAWRILYKMDKHKAFQATQTEMRDFAHRTGLPLRDLSELERLLTRDLTTLQLDKAESNPEDYLYSSGYAVHSLEAALYCILSSDSFSETLLKAVSLGEDTDSIAAIAGGVAALLYGFDAIPAHWIELLQKREEIDAVIDIYLIFM